VKSAITRFFNRGGRDYEAYVIDLGIFSEGRPRLAPGVNGEVIPVVDEQLSTIIAYSLIYPEYTKQFRQFAKADASVPEDELAASENNRQGGAKISEQGGRDSSYERRSMDGRERSDLPRTPRPTSPSPSENAGSRDVERRMLNRKKSHIKITFRDYDEKGRVTCKFVCTSYWATQFHAVREVFLSQSQVKLDDNEDSSKLDIDTEQSYIESLSSAYSWAASGGKSGATFARTSDDRFVIKNISRTELQMFLECSSAYFEYLSKAFFHGL
jgi:1-phosphatidylinositol-3-phosphate 5-kinase